MERLFKASCSGSVAELEALLQEDELLLDRVFVTCLDETPLHIAALRGHLDFVKALLQQKPELAAELNSLRASPLHLAAAAGFPEVVQELLQIKPGVSCVYDQDGRTALHLAAMKERVEVINELLRVKPNSIYERLSSGETILHLCVKHNRLGSLKILIGLQINDTEFVNSKDHCSNTILHLSVALKQIETVKFLLGIEAVKENVNVKNEHGFTALDVVDHYPDRDLKSMEIQELLLQSGATRAGQSNLQQPQSPTRDTESSHTTTKTQSPKTRCNIWKFLSGFWGKYLVPGPGWFEEVRGHLITAATLTATTAYQSGLSPPGGVWQEYANKKQCVETCTSDQPCVKNCTTVQNDYYTPGEAISADLKGYDFYYFVIYNSWSFIASICVIVLAISGLPTKNKFFLYSLVLLVYFALVSMSLAYIYTLEVTAPSEMLVKACLKIVTKSFMALSVAFLFLVTKLQINKIK
ncbi:hypothetical protein NMG60_11037426 [Bertholletia excelsa]